MDSDIVSRLKEFMEYNSLNSLTLSKLLGYKSSEKVSRLFRDEENKAKPSYDIIYDISIKFEISVDWLITGRGSMLRDSKNPEESKLGVTPIATPISPAEESIIYKMYKDEKEEKERLVKEKESKIDHLQSELLSAKEELAAFKAKYPEFPTDKPVGLGSSETAPHAHSHPHSPTSEHYHGGSLPPQENQ